jgi:hypothetical protein
MAQRKQDDLTADDRRVEYTDNGPKPGDPDDVEPIEQDPAWLPPGTQTAAEETK